MDWSIFLDYLLKILGSVGASLIITLTGILFAKLQSKIKDSKITAYVKEAVAAAEQLYPNQGTKMGPEKYAYVVQQVIAKFPNLSDNEYLKTLIESAVYTLSKHIEEKSGVESQVIINTKNNNLSSF